MHRQRDSKDRLHINIYSLHSCKESMGKQYYQLLIEKYLCCTMITLHPYIQLIVKRT